MAHPEVALPVGVGGVAAGERFGDGEGGPEGRERAVAVALNPQVVSEIDLSPGVLGGEAGNLRQRRSRRFTIEFEEFDRRPFPQQQQEPMRSGLLLFGDLGLKNLACAGGVERTELRA